MSQKNPVFYFNSNDGSSLLAFGALSFLRIEDHPSIDNIQKYINQNKSSYIFGFLSYDIKNEIESLNSKNTDELKFPIAYFFVPKNVVKIENNSFSFIQGTQSKVNINFVSHFISNINRGIQKIKTPVQWTARTSKEKYLNVVSDIINEIKNGNIYEANYCQEYYAKNVFIESPISCYDTLNSMSNAPFSSYINIDDELFSFCGSPERYIKLEDNRLTSQPIKGTAPRSSSTVEDQKNINRLINSKKDQSENVMIVDLVRNDLSKIAKQNTVKVDELCGLYSFKTVHQLVSTVSCEIDKSVDFKSILQATFPMGSMTGAPKLSAMNIIEEKEDFKRGLYSGSIGYIKPNGDFDFNVVIRSLLYNKKKKYLSCSVGGAITYDSDPKSEYDECQIKVGKLMSIFND